MFADCLDRAAGPTKINLDNARRNTLVRSLTSHVDEDADQTATQCVDQPGRITCRRIITCIGCLSLEK
jgi:hypothetical protein